MAGISPWPAGKERPASEPLEATTGQPVSKQIMGYMCAPLVCGLFSAAGLFSVPAVKCADCNCQWDNWIFFCCLNRKESRSQLDLNSLTSLISQEKSTETQA